MPAPLSSAHSQDLPLGMANPPRKAKRLRELAFREYSGEPSISPSNLYPSSPAQRAPTPPPAATPRRRGRKPAGPLSKTAREQLRKTNHSVIEKRRREKINEALAALRELVPNDKPEADKKKEDKEFKLEILVRTVEYLRMMVARVKKLEAGMCQKCRGPLSVTLPSSSLSKESELATGGKRKRPEHEDENAGDDLGSEDDHLNGVLFSAAPVTSHDAKVPTHSQPLLRLPSISSWMPDSPIDNQRTDSRAYQLPSPPRTVPFAPTNTSTSFLPGLALPSPIGPGYPSHLGSPQSTRVSPSFDPRGSTDRDVPELPLDAAPQKLHRQSTWSQARPFSTVSQTSSTSTQVPTTKHIFTPGVGDRLGENPASPWSGDDQTAASLLLNISSHRSTRAPGGVGRQERDRGKRARGAVIEAQTPSSLLGMMEGEGSN